MEGEERRGGKGAAGSGKGEWKDCRKGFGGE